MIRFLLFSCTRRISVLLLLPDLPLEKHHHFSTLPITSTVSTAVFHLSSLTWFLDFPFLTFRTPIVIHRDQRGNVEMIRDVNVKKFIFFLLLTFSMYITDCDYILHHIPMTSHLFSSLFHLFPRKTALPVSILLPSQMESPTSAPIHFSLFIQDVVRSTCDCSGERGVCIILVPYAVNTFEVSGETDELFLQILFCPCALKD